MAKSNCAVLNTIKSHLPIVPGHFICRGTVDGTSDSQLRECDVTVKQ